MSDAAPASDAPTGTSEAPAAVEPAAAPAPATAPAAAPAPVAAPAAAPAPAPATEIEDLLGDKPKADEAKANDDTSKEGDDKAKDDKKAEGAPEEYAEFKMGERDTMPSDTLTEFKAIAKEHNLSQEAAQKFVDLAGKMQQGYAETMRSTVDTLAQEWATQARADAEIGGAKFDENLGVAKKALDQFGTPELKTLLKESRLGNHPEILRMLTRAGKAISQDGFIPGRQSPNPQSAAEVLYGSTPQS